MIDVLRLGSLEACHSLWSAREWIAATTGVPVGDVAVDVILDRALP
jgi:hypothetical protein